MMFKVRKVGSQASVDVYGVVPLEGKLYFVIYRDGWKLVNSEECLPYKV